MIQIICMQDFVWTFFALVASVITTRITFTGLSSLSSELYNDVLTRHSHALCGRICIVRQNEKQTSNFQPETIGPLTAQPWVWFNVYRLYKFNIRRRSVQYGYQPTSKSVSQLGVSLSVSQSVSQSVNQPSIHPSVHPVMISQSVSQPAS